MTIVDIETDSGVRTAGVYALSPRPERRPTPRAFDRIDGGSERLRDLSVQWPPAAVRGHRSGYTVFALEAEDGVRRSQRRNRTTNEAGRSTGVPPSVEQRPRSRPPDADRTPGSLSRGAH